MSKTLEDFRKSREIREEIKQKYGGIPMSVWDVTYSENKHLSQISKQITKEERKRKYRQLKVNGVGIKNLFPSASGGGVRGKDAGLSRFPVYVSRRLLLFYSEEGDVVFDPCMGHIFESRLYTTFRLKRKYIGYDICRKYYEENLILIEHLLGEKGQQELFSDLGYKPEIYCESSEKVHLLDESIDFIFTSPPYWDLEFYDDNPKQYGYKKTYGEFLNGMTKMIGECFRILKYNKYCVLNVNDFRKGGEFYDYHCDITQIGKRVGFKLHDIIIIRYPGNMQQAFASQIENRKMTAKSHEYLITFKKVKG